MKKFLYQGLLVIALGVVILQFIYTTSLNEQIAHYKKLYLETDQILEDHLVDMHSDSNGEVVIVVHGK